MTAQYPECSIDTKGLSENHAGILASFQDFVTRNRYTLDQVETLLRAAFPHHFVYRGGNHVSLHTISGSPRIMLVGIRYYDAK